jgi:hypothetical protein
MSRHDEIAANLADVESAILAACAAAGRARSDVTLIAVTKTFPVEDAHILYELGIRNFGENRDQEGSAKAPLLSEDAMWHFQGQIQGKKIKSIIQWADVIHSLDEIEHAEKIAQRSPGHRVLIQVDLDPSGSEIRGGVKRGELAAFLEQLAPLDLSVNGLMSVAPLGVDPDRAFAELAEIFTESRSRYPSLTQLSAGMSGDFASAISHGATHIRIGSSILGKRPPLI